MRIIQQCPMCGETHYIELAEQEETQYLLWQSGDKHIQEAFANMTPCEREFIKSGYCPKCQEMIFGNGKNTRIMKGE